MSFRGGGVRTWVVQRVSALYMVFYLFAAGVLFALETPTDYFTLHTVLAQPLVNTATLVFGIALIAHMWVGMRDVLMDYIRDDATRFILLAITATSFIGLGVWFARILFRTGLT